MATEINYYTLLHVSNTATMKEIKEAYRKILLENHPDKRSNHGNFDFDLLKSAYTVLSSVHLRAAYDASFVQSNNKIRPAESIPLDSFIHDGSSFRYSCRCGNSFLLELTDIFTDVHQLGCTGCSETIWVEYELVDD